MGNDSYSCVGNEALMYSESSALAEELEQVHAKNYELEARLKEVTAQLIDLQQANCAANLISARLCRFARRRTPAL